MTTTLAMADGPDPVRKAIQIELKKFDTVSMIGAKTADGSWVLYNPIPDVIGEKAALTSLYHKRVPIRVELPPGSGKEVTMEFVSRADFLGAAIISDRHPKFREFVVKLLEILEDKGFVVVSPDENHPLVVQAKLNMDMALKVAEHDRLHAEHDRRLSSVEQGQKSLEDSVGNIADIYDHGKKWRIAMVALDQRGIKIPENMRSEVGREIAAIGRKLGYPVDTYPNGTKSKYPREPVGKFFPIHYPHAVLEQIIDVWIRENKNNPERSHLFRDIR
jgi:hypothetical protein